MLSRDFSPFLPHRNKGTRKKGITFLTSQSDSELTRNRPLFVSRDQQPPFLALDILFDMTIYFLKIKFVTNNLKSPPRKLFNILQLCCACLRRYYYYYINNKLPPTVRQTKIESGRETLV